RLVPVAAIPCFTPEEAVAELEHAVAELGLRAVMLAGVIPRPFPGHEGSPARWIDTIGHESVYDYEPLWEACERLGVAATFHASGMGWGSRMSTTNYVYNHVGNFAAAGEATARSLLFGGVPRRHPRLRFAFQEGGVASASSLYADVLGHWAKRNREAVRHYDPALLDRALLGDLADRYGVGPRDRLEYGLGMLSEPEDDEAIIDEFAASGIRREEDVVDVFTRQYHFGCEADDPMNAIAFDRRVQPHGVALRAVFASDIGHWDVPDAREVLPEAWELVEKGLLSEGDFRAFTFGNAVSLWAGGNPAFFDGTVVEDAVRRELEAGELAAR
ncbi:MAG TPA: amidohydrolase family protein, partial [Acidimicrobiales bacterium]|nr:amidohydrolase family protein [Acidimicrobiales bacterium]